MMSCYSMRSCYSPATPVGAVAPIPIRCSGLGPTRLLGWAKASGGGEAVVESPSQLLGGLSIRGLSATRCGSSARDISRPITPAYHLHITLSPRSTSCEPLIGPCSSPSCPGGAPAPVAGLTETGILLVDAQPGCYAHPRSTVPVGRLPKHAPGGQIIGTLASKDIKLFTTVSRHRVDAVTFSRRK